MLFHLVLVQAGSDWLTTAVVPGQAGTTVLAFSNVGYDQKS
jgi:hypothetical protein